MSKNNNILIFILILVFIVSGYLNIHQILGFWIPSIIILVGVILVCILIARNLKKDNGGYASFGSLVKYFAIAISIATLIGTISSVIQLSLLGETQKEAIIDRSIEASLNMYSKMGFSNEQLANMEDGLEENMSGALKPSAFLFNAFAQLFFYVLISLIPAAILKKNPPLEVG